MDEIDITSDDNRKLLKDYLTEIFTIQQTWSINDKCQRCNEDAFGQIYDVNWKYRNKIDLNRDEMCHKCLKRIERFDPDIQSEEYRKNHKLMDNIVKKYSLI